MTGRWNKSLKQLKKDLKTLKEEKKYVDNINHSLSNNANTVKQTKQPNL